MSRPLVQTRPHEVRVSVAGEGRSVKFS